MGRRAHHEIREIPISVGDFKRIKKGYRIHKVNKKERFVLYLDGKSRRIQREIEKLKRKIRELEGLKKR